MHCHYGNTRRKKEKIRLTMKYRKRQRQYVLSNMATSVV